MRSRVFVNLFAALIITISLLIFVLVNRMRAVQQAAGAATTAYEVPAGDAPGDVVEPGLRGDVPGS